MTKRKLKLFIVADTGKGGKTWKSEWEETNGMAIIAKDEQDARQQFLDNLDIGELVNDEMVFDAERFTCEEVDMTERDVIMVDSWII